MTAIGFTAQDIASMLGKTVGDDKAMAIVLEALGELGFSRVSIARPEALVLLEKISETPGIVGISARFAKSRVHLLGAPTSASAR